MGTTSAGLLLPPPFRRRRSRPTRSDGRPIPRSGRLCGAGSGRGRRGPYAALPVPGDYGAEVLPPQKVGTGCCATMGSRTHSECRRRRLGLHRAGHQCRGDGQAALSDAHNGRIMRFVPRRPMGEFERRSAPMARPGPPPMPAPERMNARTSLRPPAPVPPHLASRTPPKPEAQPAAAAPQPQPAAPVQQQRRPPPPPPDPPPVAARSRRCSADMPTQPMPPVQGLD